MKNLMIALISILTTTVFAAPETKEFDSAGLTQVVIENTSGKVSVSASTGAKATVVATKNEFTDNCLQIGAVSYLNSRPLIEGLEELLPSAKLILDYPSRLADALAILGERNLQDTVWLVTDTRIRSRHPET